MGVFLRWGIFGILVIAALIYAYNSLGRLAERRHSAGASSVAPTVAASDAGSTTPAAVPAPAPHASDTIPERCKVELEIARRAAASRSIGEPLDRVLRIQEIAWQPDEKLRARYAQLATRWYEEPGPVDAARLEREVVAACVGARP